MNTYLLLLVSVLNPYSHSLFQVNDDLLSTAGALCYMSEGRCFDFR
jgi:hypothetical protein